MATLGDQAIDDLCPDRVVLDLGALTAKRSLHGLTFGFSLKLVQISRLGITIQSDYGHLVIVSVVAVFISKVIPIVMLLFPIVSSPPAQPLSLPS